jgi:hypothetical protein
MPTLEQDRHTSFAKLGLPSADSMLVLSYSCLMLNSCLTSTSQPGDERVGIRLEMVESDGRVVLL